MGQQHGGKKKKQSKTSEVDVREFSLLLSSNWRAL